MRSIKPASSFALVHGRCVLQCRVQSTDHELIPARNASLAAMQGARNSPENVMKVSLLLTDLTKTVSSVCIISSVGC
jgi:hypothetical protein